MRNRANYELTSVRYLHNVLGLIVSLLLRRKPITHIGERAFYDCAGLTGPLSLSQIKTIGIGAFYGCKGLTF